jgi:hypothetical protein
MVKIESFCGELKSKGTLHPIAGLMVIFFVSSYGDWIAVE